MSFLIYNVETTRLVYEKASWQGYSYATEAAAKSGITRMVKKGKIVREEVAVAECRTFFAKIEKTEIVTNLMSGKQVRQAVNTPNCCSVASETFWAM